MRSDAIRKLPVLAALLGGLLLTAAPANALYLATPLILSSEQNEVQVGDNIDFDLAPWGEYEGPSYAGQDVKVIYNFDPNEGAEPREDGEPSYVEREITAFRLDDAERAAFSWTVPAEVNDRNVYVTVLAADGETLASRHLIVGEPETVVNIAAMSGPGPVDEGAAPTEELKTNDDTNAQGADGDKRAVPALGLIALVGAAVLVALVARRRI